MNYLMIFSPGKNGSSGNLILVSQQWNFSFTKVEWNCDYVLCKDSVKPKFQKTNLNQFHAIHGNDVYVEDLIFVGYPSTHPLPESLKNYSENYLD